MHYLYLMQKNMLESWLLVAPSIQDSSTMDIFNRHLNMPSYNEFNYPKKFPVYKERYRQDHLKQIQLFYLAKSNCYILKLGFLNAFNIACANDMSMTMTGICHIYSLSRI